MRSCGRPSSSARWALVERRDDQRLAHDVVRLDRFGGGRVLVHHPREQVLVEAAPVDADAHGLVVTAGDLDHLRELRVALAAAPDVARVDAVLGERGGALRVLAQQLVPVEVEVADQRHVAAEFAHARGNRRHGRGGFLGVDGDPHQLRAGHGERTHLQRGAFDVRGVRVGHRLHDDRVVAAEHHAADADRDAAAAGQSAHGLPCAVRARSSIQRLTLPSSTSSGIAPLPSTTSWNCAQVEVLALRRRRETPAAP